MHSVCATKAKALLCEKALRRKVLSNTLLQKDITRALGISARYWLRRVGFSYIKKPSPMWKQVKKTRYIPRNHKEHTAKRLVSMSYIYGRKWH